MSLTNDLSATLQRAHAERRPVEPLTSTHPELTLDDAYAIQLHQVDAWLAQGRRLVGHKVGLTSRAMQELLGVDEPDFGHLLDTMDLSGTTPINLSSFIQPRIEPEISFVLGRDLIGPSVTAADAAAAVDWVLPSLELVDSRIVDWRIGLLDTIADNASCGGFVLGSDRVRLADVDLGRVECALSVDGREAGRGVGAAVLGSPLNALAWLANVLGSRGVALHAGQVVMPGALCAMVAAEPGTEVVAEFDGLGTVSARFAAWSADV